MVSNLVDWFEKIDKQLFAFIHVDGAVPELDWLLLSLRNAYTWIPLYAFILYWILVHARKHAWQFVLFTLIVFAITDYSSASIFKPLFERARPCHDEELKPIIRGILGCGGINSLPSSHASNHFGLAAFWYLAIFRIAGKRWYWLWIWAFLIGYAQVYVGKHFPFDILAGALLGTITGTLFAIVFKRWQFGSGDALNIADHTNINSDSDSRRAENDA